jgi:hypothetical protein
VNKEGVFSHEKGMYIPVGSIDTIYFSETLDLSQFPEYDPDQLPDGVEIPDEVYDQFAFQIDLKSLFTENFLDYFVIENNGRKEPIGAITFEGEFYASLRYVEDSDESGIQWTTKIITIDEEDTGISIDDIRFRINEPGAQTFTAVINQSDVLKIDKAHAFRFIIKPKGVRGVDPDDYVILRNIKIKSSGGIKFNLD